MTLRFCHADDLQNVWGHTTIGASGLRKLADCEPPPFRVSFCRPLPGGGFDVFGVRGAKGIPWQVLRANTDDGTAFRDVRVVLEGADLDKPPNSEWAHTATVSYSPEMERYLVLKNSRDYGGSFDTHAFVSGDGERWEPSPHNPVYREGDNWGAMWSPAARRFICYNKGVVLDPDKRLNELMRDGLRTVIGADQRGRPAVDAGRPQRLRQRHAAGVRLRRGGGDATPGRTAAGARAPDLARRAGPARPGVLRRPAVPVPGDLFPAGAQLRGQLHAAGRRAGAPRRPRAGHAGHRVVDQPRRPALGPAVPGHARRCGGDLAQPAGGRRNAAVPSGERDLGNRRGSADVRADRIQRRVRDAHLHPRRRGVAAERDGAGARCRQRRQPCLSDGGDGRRRGPGGAGLREGALHRAGADGRASIAAAMGGRRPEPSSKAGRCDCASTSRLRSSTPFRAVRTTPDGAERGAPRGAPGDAGRGERVVSDPGTCGACSPTNCSTPARCCRASSPPVGWCWR